MSVAPLDKEAGIGFVFPFILPLIATTVALALYYWHTQTQRLAKYGNLIPGPPTLPFLGNAHYVIGKNHNGELGNDCDTDNPALTAWLGLAAEMLGRK